MKGTVLYYGFSRVAAITLATRPYELHLLLAMLGMNFTVGIDNALGMAPFHLCGTEILEKRKMGAMSQTSRELACQSDSRPVMMRLRKKICTTYNHHIDIL